MWVSSLFDLDEISNLQRCIESLRELFANAALGYAPYSICSCRKHSSASVLTNDGFTFWNIKLSETGLQRLRFFLERRRHMSCLLGDLIG